MRTHPGRIYFFAATLLWLAMATAAAEDTRTRIPISTEVTEAKVALTQLGIVTRRALREQDLLKSNNCIFKTTDAVRISRLVEILRKNSIEKPEGVGQIELRNIVYLYLANGSRVRLMFGQPNPQSDDVYGGMDSGKTGSYVPLLANTTLVNGIRDWALEDAPPEASSRPCLTKVKPFQKAG